MITLATLTINCDDRGFLTFKFPEAQQAPWYSPDTTVLHWHALAAITLLSSLLPSHSSLLSLPSHPSLQGEVDDTELLAAALQEDEEEEEEDASVTAI